MSRLWSENKYGIFLLLIAILAYWQIAFFTDCLKWDMIDDALPRRFFIGECLKNHIFPLWNPYQQCGYPIYASILSIWNPEVLFIGALFGYSYLTLHISFIFYIFLCGLGMYKLVNHFINNNNTSFLIGVAYMLSGFFIAHTQHAVYISSGAWIPFLILYFIKLCKNPNFINVMLTAFFGFLMITSGYPAFSIILFYLLALIFIYYVIFYIRNKAFSKLKKLIITNISLVIILLILSTGIILSILQSEEYIGRFQQLKLSKALNGPFSPQALISLLFPLSTTGHNHFFSTDISMNNLYLGLFPLLFFFYSLFFVRKSKLRILIFLFGLFALFASFGDSLPLREFLFHYIPGMDKFKYPAVFRAFTLISFLIISASGINQFLNNNYSRKKLSILLYSFIGVVLFIIIRFSFHSSFQYILTINEFDKLYKASLADKIVIQGVMQLLFLSVFLYFFQNKRKTARGILPCLIIIDMLFSVQLNIYKTGVNNKYSPVSFNKQIKNMPEGFPLPSQHAIAKHTANASMFLPAWKNTTVFTKRVSFETSNPFIFDNYYKLIEEYPVLKDSVLKNPIVYLSDQILPICQADVLKNSVIKKTLFVHDSTFQQLHNKNLKSDLNDSIRIIDFSPNQIIVKTRTEHQQILTLLQSNYKGWEIFIDGKKHPHFTSNLLFISTILPPGKHLITFQYKNNNFITAFIISYAVFFILICLIAGYYYYYSSFKHKNLTLLFILLLISFITIMFFTKKPYESKRKDIYKKINHELKLLEQKYSKSSYLISTDNPLRFAKLNDIKSSHAFYKRLYYSEDITHLWKYINKQNTSHLIYVQSNTFHLPETEEIILEKYPENIFNMKYSHSSISIFEADTNFKREHPFQSTLTFTKNKEHWSYNPNNITNINRKRALKIDSNIIYEANFSLNTKPLPLSKESKIIITSDLKFQDIKACYFVLEIIRKDKKLFYSTIPLHKFALDTSSWCHPIKQFNYEWPKDKNVAIGFYFWNPGKATLWIDRITLKIL